MPDKITLEQLENAYAVAADLAVKNPVYLTLLYRLEAAVKRARSESDKTPSAPPDLEKGE